MSTADLEGKLHAALDELTRSAPLANPGHPARIVQRADPSSSAERLQPMSDQTKMVHPRLGNDR